MIIRVVCMQFAAIDLQPLSDNNGGDYKGADIGPIDLRLRLCMFPTADFLCAMTVELKRRRWMLAFGKIIPGLGFSYRITFTESLPISPFQVSRSGFVAVPCKCSHSIRAMAMTIDSIINRGLELAGPEPNGERKGE